jgi:hypothetical protein
VKEEMVSMKKRPRVESTDLIALKFCSSQVAHNREGLIALTCIMKEAMRPSEP